MRYPGPPSPALKLRNPIRSFHSGRYFPVPDVSSLLRWQRDCPAARGSALPADGSPGSYPRRTRRVPLSFPPAASTRSLPYSLPDISSEGHSLHFLVRRSFPGRSLPGIWSPPGSYRRWSGLSYRLLLIPPSLSFFREGCWSF